MDLLSEIGPGLLITKYFSSIFIEKYSEGILFCIILPVFHQDESIWIPPTALRDALWYAILAYVFKTLWEVMRKLFSDENLYPNERRKSVVINRYNKFSKKYGDYIQETVFQSSGDVLTPEAQRQAILLAYAIMIYEDYCRPWIMRMVERIAKVVFLHHRTMSLGIMQVRTKQLISDKESIKLAISHIIDPFVIDTDIPPHVVISQYNPSDEYVTEVSAIYNILTEEVSLEYGIPAGTDTDIT